MRRVHRLLAVRSTSPRHRSRLSLGPSRRLHRGVYLAAILLRPRGKNRDGAPFVRRSAAVAQPVPPTERAQPPWGPSRCACHDGARMFGCHLPHDCLHGDDDIAQQCWPGPDDLGLRTLAIMLVVWPVWDAMCTAAGIYALLCRARGEAGQEHKFDMRLLPTSGV